MLYSNPALAQYVLENRIHIASPVLDTVVKPSFWYLPPPEAIYSKKLAEIESISRARGFSNFVERKTGYFDLHCFLSPEPQAVALSHFMDLKDKLEVFGDNFRSQLQKIIFKITKDPFIVPKEMRPNFKGLSPNEIGKYESHLDVQFEKMRIELQRLVIPKNRNSSGFYLTQRELFSIMGLVRGKTIQETADEQGLSPRTIEQYLDSVKAKLGCNKKSEIIDNMMIRLNSSLRIC